MINGGMLSMAKAIARYVDPQTRYTAVKAEISPLLDDAEERRVIGVKIQGSEGILPLVWIFPR